MWVGACLFILIVVLFVIVTHIIFIRNVIGIGLFLIIIKAVMII
jgi:hypothetical protein